MSSIAGAAASKTLWGKIKSVPIQHPFAFGFFLSGFKTSFSDLLVQKVVEQRETIDWKRNAAFASFGFFYLGGVQYAIYVPLFSRMFPGAAGFAAKSLRDKLKDAKGMFQCGAQVVLDQCVHHPLMYFPVFYCTRELVVHDKPDLKRCLNEYRGNMKEDLVALWKVWVPSTIINFAFMPMWARIPFVAATSLLWTSILSAMRGGDVRSFTLFPWETGLAWFVRPALLTSILSFVWWQLFLGLSRRGNGGRCGNGSYVDHGRSWL
jgi:hypothetical protein